MADELPPQGKVYKYKNLIFWPQGGTVCIEDTRDGDFHAVTAAEFAARVITVRMCLKADRYRYADERNEDFNFIENGSRCVKEARRQGDPFDPEVLAHLLRHRRRSYIFNAQGEAVGSYTATGADGTPESAMLPPVPAPTRPADPARQVRPG